MSFEFVNDWSELENALASFRYDRERSIATGEGRVGHLEDVEAVLKYVPRLMKQYEDLLEILNQAVDGIAEFKRLGEGGQLLVADSQEVRQFGA